MFKFNKSAGEVSRLLLVLAIIVLVAVVITYLIVRMVEQPPPPPPPPPVDVVPPLVYEKTLGNIRFVFLGARDLGNTLTEAMIKNKQYYSRQEPVTTKEKFIEVTIGAQNMGKLNIENRSWDIENIVDSESREFVPLDGYKIRPWLPEQDLCGTLLKPAFDPTPCVKIYEVSSESAGLKIRIMTGKDNLPGNMDPDKAESALLDLIIR